MPDFHYQFVDGEHVYSLSESPELISSSVNRNDALQNAYRLYDVLVTEKMKGYVYILDIDRIFYKFDTFEDALANAESEITAYRLDARIDGEWYSAVEEIRIYKNHAIGSSNLIAESTCIPYVENNEETFDYEMKVIPRWV